MSRQSEHTSENVLSTYPVSREYFTHGAVQPKQGAGRVGCRRGQIRSVARSRQLFIRSTEEDVMERSTEKAYRSFTPRVARDLKNVSKINTHSY